MKIPKISVIMPAYNAEKYISEAIESILNQTFTDFEFIIINDGSKDDTAKIVKDYAEKDKRIKFIDNKENQGIVVVLNQGLSLACGEYIARMDSDDISHQDRFEKQVAYMDTHSECGVLSTAYHMFGSADKTVIHPEYVGLLTLAKGCYVAHPAVMVRKNILDKYELAYSQDFKFVEDYELWSRVIMFTEIHNLTEVLLEYRWHGGNISIEHSKRQSELTKRIKTNILNKITKAPIEQQKLLKPGMLLPKWLGRICCLFIWKRAARHNFRGKYVQA